MKKTRIMAVCTCYFPGRAWFGDWMEGIIGAVGIYAFFAIFKKSRPRHLSVIDPTGRRNGL